MNSLISTITPCYNTAREYLCRLIDSIINQSYTNLEIVLVDDGSTDETGKILDEYMAKDKRVVVVHKKNGGEQSARNAGLYKATGEYLFFTDSDDEIPQNAIETLYSKMQGKVDFVFGSYFFFFCNGSPSRISGCTREIATPAEIAHDVFFENHLYGIREVIFPCDGKLYRHSIIRENNLSFDESIHLEGCAIFVVQYLSYCRKVFNVIVPTYIYYKYDISQRFQATQNAYPDAFLMVEDLFKPYFGLLADIMPAEQKFIYQYLSNNLIRLLVRGAMYENEFRDFERAMMQCINSDFLINAVSHYKRERKNDSIFIPFAIKHRWGYLLIRLLRKRAKKLSRTARCAEHISMNYFSNIKTTDAKGSAQ
jgi:glycosyltransferase involved in cell wall biosynthesis